MYLILVLVSLVVSTNLIDCTDRLASEMMCFMVCEALCSLTLVAALLVVQL